MVVCAPARRAHSPPGAGHRGNRVVFLFICRKVFLQGAWRHSPAYLCTRPLAGRAGTPKGQRIFRQNRRLRRRERALRARTPHARHARRHARRAHRRTPDTHTATPNAHRDTRIRAHRRTPNARRDTRIRAHAGGSAPAAFRGMSRGFPRDFRADRGHRAQHVPCALPRGGARFFA